MDVGVAGPTSAPQPFPRSSSSFARSPKSVPSPMGGTVYEEWKLNRRQAQTSIAAPTPLHNSGERHVGDLGSGSDFTPFLQHAGVPSTDIGSGGPYGVYHSAFDDLRLVHRRTPTPTSSICRRWPASSALKPCAWPTPTFCPTTTRLRARDHRPTSTPPKRRPPTSGSARSTSPPPSRRRPPHRRRRQSPRRPGRSLRRPRHAQPRLAPPKPTCSRPAGLPNRPWYRHTIYAPGEYTGYSAVVIPGVNEAIDAKDAARGRRTVRRSHRRP